MYSVTPALSLTGDVFGMQATAVNPPATADAVPVATVSLCSCPGSRRCTCMSNSPGVRTNPAGTSTTAAPSIGRSFPTREMRFPSIRMSNTPSRPFAGSITRPLLSSRFMFSSTRQEVQNRHPNGDAVRDLLENHRIRTVCHLGVDFDSAVHRSRMHDDGVVLRAPHALARHAEDRKVLAQRGKERALHAFELYTQQHDHVGTLDGLVHRRRARDPFALDPRGHQRRRPAHPHL